MTVLDASVLIGHLDASDAQHEAAAGLLLAAVGEALHASVITIAEVLVGPARAKRIDEAESALAALELQPVPLAAAAAIRLAELRAATGLKLPDCCVLLVAHDVGGDVATLDDRLGRAAEALGFRVTARGDARSR